MRILSLLAFALASPFVSPGPALAAPPQVVAAENFYGDVARQIAGDKATVVDVIARPDQDPHDFEPTAQTARDVAGARIVVLNGAGYDGWMDKLLHAQKAAGRRVIDVAALTGKKAGDNPHLWYNPATMKIVAAALSLALTDADPAHRADYQASYDVFAVSLRPIEDKIKAMRAKYSGVAIAATEPVFGYMADLIGLATREKEFALAVMNDSEPSPSQVAAFENDLKGRKVRALIVNAQATSPSVKRLRNIAQEIGMPVVAVSETEPADTPYQKWMLLQLEALDKALGESAAK